MKKNTENILPNVWRKLYAQNANVSVFFLSYQGSYTTELPQTVKYSSPQYHTHSLNDNATPIKF